MAGTVRHLVGEPDGAQLLYEVQEFRSPCPPAAVIHRHPMALPNAMLAGIGLCSDHKLLVTMFCLTAHSMLRGVWARPNMDHFSSDLMYKSKRPMSG